jgi:hypothetical protein
VAASRTDNATCDIFAFIDNMDEINYVFLTLSGGPIMTVKNCNACFLLYPDSYFIQSVRTYISLTLQLESWTLFNCY